MAKPSDSVEPGFEEALSEVESIIERIEAGEIGLEESIAAYERGAGLIKRCRGLLDAAERRISELTEDGRVVDRPVDRLADRPEER